MAERRLIVQDVIEEILWQQEVDPHIHVSEENEKAIDGSWVFKNVHSRQRARQQKVTEGYL